LFFKLDYAKRPDAHIYKPHFNGHTKIHGRTNAYCCTFDFPSALNTKGTENE